MYTKSVFLMDRNLPGGKILMHKIHFLKVLHPRCYLGRHVYKSAETETESRMEL